MKNSFKKQVWILILVLSISVIGISVAAEEVTPEETTETATEPKDQQEPVASEDEVSVKEAGPSRGGVSINAAKGEVVSGMFEKINGKDIATIRYYTDAAKTKYAFAEFRETSSGYEYSFSAPFNGFDPVEGTNKNEANVVAEYFDLNTWDGAVDVSWYNETDDSFDISTPAQLAGLAAVVNGSINNTTPIYRVKGIRTDSDGEGRKNLTGPFDYDTPKTSKHQKMNEGLPDCIENTYYEKTNLIAGVEDEAYEGLVEHDFSDRTVNITSDLDMGGTDPSNIDHSKNESANYYKDTYPNWTPIGGEYLMDPSRGATMIKASFNGSLNGCGHNITNLYCYRWSYRSVGETAYGYAQGTGLIGMMGSLYEGESEPTIMPSVKNISLYGYIYGRRMVGGFVGCMGGGANAASGTSVEGGITMENLANHADVYCTDSKGLAGIVACSMVERGSIINCYNTGYMDANYAAPTGGIIGDNEGMSVYCCYNTGTLYTHGNKRGRGIGSGEGGKNYKINHCYYLEGCGDDPQNPGYRAFNTPKSVSVTTESMTEQQMTDGTLLEKLNENGIAYVAGDDGYPVLFWEKNADPGTGNLSLDNSFEFGTIDATEKGVMKNGTVVYLSNNAETGWKCRKYKLNGADLSGSYVTVNGDCAISGYFEEVKPGIIMINKPEFCTVTIKKNGTIIDDDNKTVPVTNYTVNDRDSVFEDDVLMVSTTLDSGAVPEDPDLVYQASVSEYFSNPYQYTYTYVDDEDIEEGSPYETILETYTVENTIGEDGIALKMDVVPLTTQKLWRYSADTSWYDDTKTEFTITTARQLAGLAVLVNGGKNFAGKTVRLGNDISLKNDDGTEGRRFWDGIGSEQEGSAGFAGVFDGNGHKITEYNGNSGGFFKYCEGTSKNNKAVIKNLEIQGECEGENSCGVVMKAKNTVIDNCVSYTNVKGSASSNYSAAILGYAFGECEIKNCVNYAQIEGRGYVGGVVGEMNTTSVMTACVNRGNVFSLNSGGAAVGGLVGSLNGQMYYSSNYGNIWANCGNVGGVAGQSVSQKAIMESCGNYGEVTYRGGRDGVTDYDSLGGIIGYGMLFNVNNSFNYGTVIKASGTMPNENIGGVFGRYNKNSKCLSEDVYYLDSSCKYAAAGTKAEDLDKKPVTPKGYM